MNKVFPLLILAELKKSCRGCKLDENRVVFPSGFWLEVGTDPGVIEVQTKPSTLEEIEKARNNLQKLFDACATARLKPDITQGGGHINIGYYGSFINDKHRRNFIVDYMNHPELALGAHELDLSNAPPLLVLSYESKILFDGLLSVYDDGLISLPQFLEQVQNQVYEHSENKFPKELGGEPEFDAKYHALNFASVSDNDESKRRFEVRAVRTQTSVEQIIKDLKLYRGRIRFLENRGEITYDSNRFPQSVEDLRRMFYEYVTKSGLEWEDYKSYLPRNWAQLLHDWGLPCTVLRRLTRNRWKR